MSFLSAGLPSWPRPSLLVAQAANADDSATAGLTPITRPTVISRPGSYVLARNLDLDEPGAAIVVSAGGPPIYPRVSVGSV